ncbi:pentapeptide repeat-containing protein [Nostoc sp. FACHB-280]|uniref:pentapeptide repeat-containing protein n=1 Tax=Nostoc sp. FACHB-280 TaxID=2692839 RepID=UPI00168ADA31|nr:pentapeptide repeat-containing protein [Nostoc sp. FACHB-280]MBD2497964.1 pentapeptide repeat-containing protein [Nostoc sp. FACHB-280]
MLKNLSFTLYVTTLLLIAGCNGVQKAESNTSSTTTEAATTPTETNQAVSPTPEVAATPTETNQAASPTPEAASTTDTSSSVSKDIERLQRNQACPGCDLSGANLADANLGGIDLSGANTKSK